MANKNEIDTHIPHHTDSREDGDAFMFCGVIFPVSGTGDIVGAVVKNPQQATCPRCKVGHAFEMSLYN